jgi:hypothetical protein
MGIMGKPPSGLAMGKGAIMVNPPSVFMGNTDIGVPVPPIGAINVIPCDVANGIIAGAAEPPD